MNKITIFIVIFELIFISAFGQSSNENEQCERLKKEKIDVSFADDNYGQEQFFKMIQCGFDSIDCMIAKPLFSALLINKLNKGEVPEIKYGELIAELLKLKNAPGYEQARNETINPPKIVDDSAAFLKIPQYDNYEHGRTLQLKSKKPLLIYFTGKYSVNSRKMEDSVLSDPSILDSLNKFIIVRLFVDDPKVGKKNIKLQETKFNSFWQPQIVIEFIDGTWKKIGYCTVEEFEKFIAF